MAIESRDRLVDALRSEAQALDDISRARMERRLIEALRQHDAALEPSRSAGRKFVVGSDAQSTYGSAGAPRGVVVRRLVWAASITFAIFLGAWGTGRLWDAPHLQPAAAHFEIAIGELAVQSGSLREGQLLESRRQGRGHVSVGDSRIDLDRHTRVRFDRLRADALDVTLTRGAVDVAFHPAPGSRQQMRVSTHTAQVEVVGTEFRVQVDAEGRTEVHVRSGQVRVRDREGDRSALVASGQVLRVLGGGEPFEGPRLARRSEGPEAEPSGAAVDRVREAPAEEVPVAAEPSATAAGEAAEAAVSAAPRRDVIEDPKRDLEHARHLLHQGRHAAARRRLMEVSEAHVPKQVRAEALTLIAESHAVQGRLEQAARAYRRAAFVGRGTASGDNAIFALARLLERAGREEAARDAYRRYLQEAPRGALAGQARRSLCRLGDAAHCSAAP